MSGVGAKGSVIYSTKPVREYRDAVGIDERISYLAWLFQQNRGVFKSPWTKQETWTLSVWHTEDDAARYVANFEEFATSAVDGVAGRRDDAGHEGETTMSTTEHVEIDLGLVEELTKRETAALDEKHARSLSYREEARTHLPGGVSSSWQTWPPHPIYVDRGQGSRVWDIDGNEYVDYHNGYGVMVMGHAHPKIVEAVRERSRSGTHFAQPTEDALPVAEQLAERTGLPYWRFGNSGPEATLDAVRIMRASTGRDLIVKVEGTYHGHHDALMVSVFPPEDKAGRATGPTPCRRRRLIRRHARVGDQRAVQRPRGRAARVRRARRRDRRHDRRAGDDELRRRAARRGLPRGLKEVCHTHGAMFAYDEVKTGFTVAWGGAIEAFGVQPDLVAFAKALGAGLPCGAIGGTEEAMAGVIAATSTRSARSTATRSRWPPRR